MRVRIGQLSRLADNGNFQIAPKPGFADAGIPDSRFDARIGADQQQRIRFFDAHQGRVQKVMFTHAAGAILCARRSAVGIPDAEAPEEIERRFSLLHFDQVAGNHADLVHADRQRGFNRVQRFRPCHRMQLAIPAHIRTVETLARETVPDEPGLVRQPFLIDLFIRLRKDPHHCVPFRVNPDRRTHGIHYVDG